jgi:hypothetical protein
MAKKLALVHPGEILREEFLVPLKLTLGSNASREENPVTPTPPCGSANSSRPALRSGCTFKRASISKRPKTCSGHRSRRSRLTRRRENDA